MKRYRRTEIPSLLQGDTPDGEEYCYKCNKYMHCDFHHILPGANKKASEETGAWVWLCRECHRWAHDTPLGKQYMRFLKEQSQIVYEETHTRAEWMKKAHKNYL